jgi:caffeoyl-CoA O-methyltransferase
MKSYSAQVTPEIGAYLEQTFTPQDLVLKEIVARSKAKGLPQIHVAPMDGLHLEVLTRISGAKKAVEIGTLGGYSGVCISRGMGPEGFLYTFDADRKHTEVATESFRKAGVIERVKTFIGPAIDNLPKINSEGPFDLVFVDADKVGYPAYLQWAAENLRIGGLLIGDNTLGWGMIAHQNFENPEDEPSVRALQTFNKTAAQSGRFKTTLLPTGEGLTVAVKIK